MDNDDARLDLEEHAPIADPQAVIRDEVFEAFHVASQVAAHPLDLPQYPA